MIQSIHGVVPLLLPPKCPSSPPPPCTPFIHSILPAPFLIPSSSSSSKNKNKKRADPTYTPPPISLSTPYLTTCTVSLPSPPICLSPGQHFALSHHRHCRTFWRAGYVRPWKPLRIGSRLDHKEIEMENYDDIKEIGSGNFGVAHLMHNKKTRELVAVKYIERGPKIDENVQREIINHRSLRHPNIIRFKEVFLTPTHLAIAMEYAAGGELFQKICSSGRFTENEARYYFQQLIMGISYCHKMRICHRDLKLENILLDGSSAPRIKICDFGYSKSSMRHSQPKSAVGTPAYIAPEILLRKGYDGKIADVWSCGVTLYVMLVGAYPFEDPSDPNNFRKIITRIMKAQYTFPEHVRVSQECHDILARIFMTNPAKRITIREIKSHPWFRRNLPRDLSDEFVSTDASEDMLQSEDEIMRIVNIAKVSAVPKPSDLCDPEEMEYQDAAECSEQFFNQQDVEDGPYFDS